MLGKNSTEGTEIHTVVAYLPEHLFIIAQDLKVCQAPKN